MNRTIPSLFLAATASFATVPVAFTSGTPAKADDVNKNFASLDSAIQKKAEASLVSVLQTAVAGKADQASLAKLSDTVKGKADQTKLDDLTKTVATKASQSDLNAKKDSVWIVSTINGKLPTGLLSAVNNLKDVADPVAARTNLGLGSLAVKNSLLAKDVGALDQGSADARYLNTGGGTLSGALYLKQDSPLRDTTGSWLFGYGSSSIGIGSAASGNGLPVTIWTGSSDTAAVFAPNHISFGRALWLGRKGEAATINFNRSADGAAAAFIGYDSDDKTMLYKAVGGGGAHVWWTNPGQPGVPAAKTMMLDQNGNLNVSGTITGSVVLSSAIKASDVADYVFEPDYKLMPLSEVEAFT